MSKFNNQTSKQPLSEVSKNEIWQILKNDVKTGNINKENLRKAYKLSSSLSDADQAVFVKNFCEELYGNSSKENFHKFVIALAHIESEVVNNKDLTPNAKINDYFRNTSLAKNAMLFEASKEGFIKDIYEALKKNDLESATLKLADLKIPSYILETYKVVDDYYSKNNSPSGAAINLSFHCIQTGLIHLGRQEGLKVEQQANLIKNINTYINKGLLNKESKEKSNGVELIAKQIRGEEITTEEREEFKKQHVEPLIDMIKASKTQELKPSRPISKPPALNPLSSENIWQPSNLGHKISKDLNMKSFREASKTFKEALVTIIKEKKESLDKKIIKVQKVALDKASAAFDKVHALSERSTKVSKERTSHEVGQESKKPRKTPKIVQKVKRSVKQGYQI